jgi:hypothetical protein
MSSYRLQCTVALWLGGGCTVASFGFLFNHEAAMSSALSTCGIVLCVAAMYFNRKWEEQINKEYETLIARLEALDMSLMEKSPSYRALKIAVEEARREEANQTKNE